MTSEAIVASLLARCVFPAPGSAAVCAVSGGADSLALLVLASAAELDITAVHVDHGLRPDSADDADVVSAVAAAHGASFRSERVSISDGGDLEARARTARWQVLGHDALTGHTADDQAETLLINLLRGAGLDGLAAMEPGGRHPLLGLRRAETVALCGTLGLQPVEDSSNLDPRFVRNRVRHELLPLMAEISDRDVVPLLTRTSDIARSASEELARAAAPIDPTSAAAVAAAPEPLAAVALRRWLTTSDGYAPTTAEIGRVLAVARCEAVGCQLSRGRSVRRTGGILRIDQ